MRVSAIILNSDKRDIDRTRKSVAWCDEIIVWTKPIEENFATARNEAMATAKNDWVLFIDSDEELSGSLPSTFDGLADGYYLRRYDIFWGKKLKHGEVGATRLLRFGRKSAGLWVRKVHEYWNIKKTGNLDIFFLHHPHPTVREFIETINTYTNIDAEELAKEGKKFSYFRLFANPVGKFVDNYFVKLGLADGWPGFVYAFMMSFHSLVVRVKMAA